MQASPATTATAPTPSPDHALDALRAARLRRQLADEGSSIFVHLPLAARHNQALKQNEFGAYAIKQEGGGVVVVSVARPVSANYALLGLGRGFLLECAKLPPAQLRAMAAIFIDAAHDIEAHPAAALDPEREAA